MANALKDELIYNCAKEYSELKSKGDKGAYVTFFIDRIVPVIYPGKPKEMNRKSVIRLLNRVLILPKRMDTDLRTFAETFFSQLVSGI